MEAGKQALGKKGIQLHHVNINKNSKWWEGQGEGGLVDHQGNPGRGLVIREGVGANISPKHATWSFYYPYWIQTVWRCFCVYDISFVTQFFNAVKPLTPQHSGVSPRVL
jgi:hypothetical protein